MFGLSAGLVVELLVAVLLATTIGYCVLLNARLKRLHADRDQLRQMVTDLVQATGLANNAIQELKTTARTAEDALSERLAESESFASRLAEQMAAGNRLLERITRIASASSRTEPVVMPEPEPQPAPVAEDTNKLRSALAQLATRPRISGNAA